MNEYDSDRILICKKIGFEKADNIMKRPVICLHAT